METSWFSVSGVPKNEVLSIFYITIKLKHTLRRVAVVVHEDTPSVDSYSTIDNLCLRRVGIFIQATQFL